MGERGFFRGVVVVVFCLFVCLFFVFVLLFCSVLFVF